jgi:hypothetical protein
MASLTSSSSIEQAMTNSLIIFCLEAVYILKLSIGYSYHILSNMRLSTKKMPHIAHDFIIDCIFFIHLHNGFID